MNSGENTNYIVLEKGTDDISLLYELDEMIECINPPFDKEFVSMYPYLYELRYLLKRMVSAYNSNQNDELLEEK